MLRLALASALSLVLALYVIGLIGFNAMSRDFSNAPRSWKTRFSLAFWPIVILAAWILDRRDNFMDRQTKRALIVAILSLACVTLTHAFDKPEYQNLDPKVRDWFKSVRSPHGVPCCDMADGHRTDYDIRSDGYWVPIGGEMRHVPPEAIVYNSGNPVGEAVVWYVPQGVNTYYIRCFVPGGGV